MDISSVAAKFLTENWKTVTVLLLITLLYWHYISNFTVLKKLGLNGPTPLPLFGCLFPLFTGKPLYQYFSDTVQKYGKVCGVYFFSTPTILVADPDMLKLILVKDFDKFHDRHAFGVEVTEEPTRSMLNIATGQRWKNIRSVLTPAFTSGKLKQMMFIMEQASETLLMKLEKAANDKVAVDIHQWQKGVTMEVILSTAFGLKTESQTNPDDKLTHLAKQAMTQRPWTGLALLIPVIGKWLASKISCSDRFGFPFNPLARVAKDIVKKRREKCDKDTKRKDILELLLDSQKPDAKGYHLTENEVIAQMILFILAGYDTSASILGLTCHHLAIFPEIQDKVVEEIHEACSTTDLVTYEELQKMPYLEACISETLRLYPPAITVRRCVTESCTLNGIPLKKGMGIVIPVYAMHHDAQYWPEPEKFQPERFLPENKASIKQFTYLPFGDGPRNCIGMRFAMLQMKAVLVRMIQKYRLVKGPETKSVVKMKRTGVFSPAEPVLIRLEKRDKLSCRLLAS